MWEVFAAGGEVSFGEGDPRATGFDPASWGEERTVRAEVLARLLLGAGPAEVGQRRRVWMRGAKIVGALDLNATVLDFELIAVNCYFDGVVDLGDAQTRSLELAACRVMALNMWDMRVDGGLDFYGLMCGSIVLGNSRRP